MCLCLLFFAHAFSHSTSSLFKFVTKTGRETERMDESTVSFCLCVESKKEVNGETTTTTTYSAYVYARCAATILSGKTNWISLLLLFFILNGWERLLGNVRTRMRCKKVNGRLLFDVCSLCPPFSDKRKGERQEFDKGMRVNDNSRTSFYFLEGIRPSSYDVFIHLSCRKWPIYFD